MELNAHWHTDVWGLRGHQFSAQAEVQVDEFQMECLNMFWLPHMPTRNTAADSSCLAGGCSVEVSSLLQNIKITWSLPMYAEAMHADTNTFAAGTFAAGRPTEQVCAMLLWPEQRTPKQPR